MHQAAIVFVIIVQVVYKLYGSTLEPASISFTPNNLFYTDMSKVPSASDTCAVKFETIGCFSDNQQKPRPLPQLLFTDRDQTSHKFSGHLIDWKKWDEYIRDIACRCAKRADEKGFPVFGLQFYGECWSGTNGDSTYNRDGATKSCTTYGHAKCSDSSRDCVGNAKTNFVYTIKRDRVISPATVTPTTAVTSQVPKTTKATTKRPTAVTSQVPMTTKATTKRPTAVTSQVPMTTKATTKRPTAVTSQVPMTTKATTKRPTAVTSQVPMTTKATSKRPTAVTSQVPMTTKATTNPPTAVTSQVPMTTKATTNPPTAVTSQVPMTTKATSKRPTAVTSQVTMTTKATTNPPTAVTSQVPMTTLPTLKPFTTSAGKTTSSVPTTQPCPNQKWHLWRLQNLKCKTYYVVLRTSVVLKGAVQYPRSGNYLKAKQALKEEILSIFGKNGKLNGLHVISFSFSPIPGNSYAYLVLQFLECAANLKPLVKKMGSNIFCATCIADPLPSPQQTKQYTFPSQPNCYRVLVSSHSPLCKI